MKVIEIHKFNFNQLIEKLIEGKSRLTLPAYQREYSWDTQNWKELFDDIKDLVKENRKKPIGEHPNIWFLGSIIFQKKSNGVDYDIIDGQQRLITFFILLIAIYSVIPAIDDQDKKRIRKFLFYDWYEGWTKGNPLSLRIELDNPNDQIDLRTIIPFATTTNNLLEKREERKRNIIRAKNFFTSSTRINTGNCRDIYSTILDNFYFSLIILDEETDSEIFMTLNTAGEDLTIPDLVKSLLTRRNDYWAKKFSETWEEKIVKKICFPPASKKNSEWQGEKIFDCFLRSPRKKLL